MDDKIILLNLPWCLGRKKIKEEFLMTNTKFRKKALLSSVAMLLVALVALGSATFAWFASNPTVTASGIKMTASASTGIKIMSASEITAGLTKSAANFTQTGVVLHAIADPTKVGEGEGKKPAVTERGDLISDTDETHINLSEPIIPSIDSDPVLSSGSNWYNASGVDATDGSKNTTFGAKALGASNSYTEDIWTIRTDATKAEQIKSATVTISNNSGIGQAVRVALLGNDGKLLGVWAPSSRTASGYDGDETPSSITNAAASGSPINFTGKFQDVSTDGESKVTVVVYLDGEDGNATSAAAAAANLAAIVSSITVVLSIAEAA
jgi:hypothetical protein